jgi:hypothetical protein
MTRFGTLHPDGNVTHERDIDQAKMQACPHFIMVSEHYRQDQTCRCDDPTHTEMAEWEYTWNGKAWV